MPPRSVAGDGFKLQADCFEARGLDKSKETKNKWNIFPLMRASLV